MAVIHYFKVSFQMPNANIWIAKQYHPCAIIKFTQKNLKRVVTYTHELPMGHGSQNWFWSFHIGPSGENSDPQFLGHKIKIDPILLILVPNDTYSDPNLPIK